MRTKKGIGLQLEQSMLKRAEAVAVKARKVSGMDIQRADVLRAAIERGLPLVEDQWRKS